MNHCKAYAAGGKCTSNEGYVARFGLVRHTEKQEPKCNPHPKAPHGFNRNASHANDRYICECEGWDAYDAGYQAGVMAGIETAMGEEQKQEPEWYHVIDVHGCNRFYHKTEDCPYKYKKPLYTQPQEAAPRQWVGLTSDEFVNFVDSLEYRTSGLIRAVEAKLKEKNSTPPQSQPLDMSQIVQLTYDIDEDKPATMAELFRFARAIEAAHGIKE